VGAAVEALFRQGLTVPEVLACRVASEPFVYRVRRRMGERGEIDYRLRPPRQPAGIDWTQVRGRPLES
jgi:hypothetical protein